MARPRVAAGALIRNEAGEILLVKPTYKDGWEIPGGYVEPGESPKAACEREIQEELGVERGVGNLLVVDWAPAPEEGEKLLFVFEGPPDVRLEDVRLPGNELCAIAYYDQTDLIGLLPPRLARRVVAALEPDEKHVIYLEHGVPPNRI